MRAGEFPEGAHVLRAKIDMASPNINLRDPTIYRIKRAPHHRTGDRWVHLSDVRLRARAVGRDRGHHPLDLHARVRGPSAALRLGARQPAGAEPPAADRVRPPQPELHGVEQAQAARAGRRSGTSAAGTTRACRRIAGLRRRGYTPEAIRAFCAAIGVAKRDSVVDVAMLEHAVRDDLNRRAPRAMAVLRPLRVVIDNYPEGQIEELEAVNNPEDAGMGTRRVPFSRVLYIERDDFREDPPKQFFRLAPGREVRLRYAYFIRCERVVKDERSGEVVELHCTYDPATRGGDAPDGRKVKATLHWVSAAHAVAGRGAAVRPPVHGREPERREGRARLEEHAEPAVARSAARLSARAEPGGGRAGQPLPVRTARLLLRRQRWTRSRAAWSSTAPSPCAIPGPRSRSEAGVLCECGGLPPLWGGRGGRRRRTRPPHARATPKRLARGGRRSAAAPRRGAPARARGRSPRRPRRCPG